MNRGGVATVRTLLRWREVEPEPTEFNWASFDELVEGASARDVEVLPFVYGSPSWLAEPEKHAPIDSAQRRRGWRGFLTRLVNRYGTAGSFVKRTDSAPITRWQIWNEPNFRFYWHGRPSAAAYARLLKISSAAIRSADPEAEIVTGGVAPVRSGTRWWTFLRELYEVTGIRESFDALALHPYSPTIGDLRVQIELARQIMRDNGDRMTPLALTEVGWSSGREDAPLVVGPRRQARLLTKAYALANDGRYRISETDWFAWQDSIFVEPFCTFCPQAGLFDLDGKPKPSWIAFRRAARRRAR